MIDRVATVLRFAGRNCEPSVVHISWVGSCDGFHELMYTQSNKNPSARNFLSPEPEVTCGTVAIII